MDVGRSGEVQGVVGRVWEAEIIGFFNGYSKKSEKKVRNLEKKVIFGCKSVS